MAVVLLASYSCVQDTTEDLGPVVSGSGQEGGKVATLRVSMPASSRTALGDKVDGKYPVSWCEGDVLTVNGKPTTSITISEEDSGVAIFELPLGITIPYNIVYPYIGEDSVESKDGKYPVMFLTEQQHTAHQCMRGLTVLMMFIWSTSHPLSAWALRLRLVRVLI